MLVFLYLGIGVCIVGPHSRVVSEMFNYFNYYINIYIFMYLNKTNVHDMFIYR